MPVTSDRRIALLGLSLECNSFAPHTTRDDFLGRLYLAGDEILHELEAVHCRLPKEVLGFRSAMDSACAWTPIPILIGQCESGGPLEHDFFTETLHEITTRLRAAMPLDGVYIASHGALLTTACRDPDGVLFAAVRDVVGDEVPVVATLDLHANVSARMVEEASTIIGYQTNPHVDMFERGADAARSMLSLWLGKRVFPALVTVPLIASPVCLSTHAGPYADLWEQAKRVNTPEIASISLFGGFAFADTEKNGLSIVVNSLRSPEHGREVAEQLGEIAWSDRSRYVPRLVSLDEAVAQARDAGAVAHAPRVLLADVADNPAGGGTGSITALINALIDADVPDALVGLLHDPELAAGAWRLGEGNTFEVVFSDARDGQAGAPRKRMATVLKLSDGDCVGRRGLYAGRRVNLGTSALLAVGGVRIAVVTHRCQCADPAFLEMFGEDLREARAVVVKSRGHFRTGFDEFFSDDQIIEVDAPGLTSPVLSRFRFEHVKRPIYPLDSI